ncbi:MAG: class I SAM-dependent methyltransferase [Actinomycetota bacterium]
MSNTPVNTDHAGRVIDFGRTAVDYEEHRPGFPDSFFDRVLEMGWAESDQRLLDVGTGTGSLALGFAERGLAVGGLDIAPELLDVARRAASDRGLSVTLMEGSAEHTGCHRGSFDIVTAGQCWWWFDEEAAIAETLRILVPGGRLIIASFSYQAFGGNVAERTETLVLKHNPGWTLAGWRGVHPEHVRALDRGGFENVESFSYMVDVPFSHEAWRGRVRTCNGVGSALDSEQVEAFDGDMVSMLAEEFPGELTVPHRVFVASGTKPSVLA